MLNSHHSIAKACTYAAPKLRAPHAYNCTSSHLAFIVQTNMTNIRLGTMADDPELSGTSVHKIRLSSQKITKYRSEIK